MDELPQICKPWNKPEVVERIIAPYLNLDENEEPTDSESEFDDDIDERIDEWLDEGSQYR